MWIAIGIGVLILAVLAIGYVVYREYVALIDESNILIDFFGEEDIDWDDEGVGEKR